MASSVMCLDGACSCDLLKKRSEDDSRWVLEDAAAHKLSAAVRRIGEDTKGFLFRAYWLDGRLVLRFERDYSLIVPADPAPGDEEDWYDHWYFNAATIA